MMTSDLLATRSPEWSRALVISDVVVSLAPNVPGRVSAP
jgi:hypothetical protein